MLYHLGLTVVLLPIGIAIVVLYLMIGSYSLWLVKFLVELCKQRKDWCTGKFLLMLLLTVLVLTLYLTVPTAPLVVLAM